MSVNFYKRKVRIVYFRMSMIGCTVNAVTLASSRALPAMFDNSTITIVYKKATYTKDRKIFFTSSGVFSPITLLRGNAHSRTQNQIQQKMRATRIILAVFAFCAGYLIATFVIMSVLPIPKVIVNNSNLASATVAVVFSFLVWKGTAHIQGQLLTRMFQGGFIGGVLGFVLAFVGALVFYPDCNICPVMSIFIAPVGFVVGLFGGWLVWKIRSANITH